MFENVSIIVAQFAVDQIWGWECIDNCGTDMIFVQNFTPLLWQARFEGGEVWRCQEDKRLGDGGVCTYDCCASCMQNQGVGCWLVFAPWEFEVKLILKGVPDKGSGPFSGTNTTGKTEPSSTTPDSFYITQRIQSLPIATMYQKIIFRHVNLLKAGLKSTQASARRGPRESWIIWCNARSTLHLSPINVRILKWS